MRYSLIVAAVLIGCSEPSDTPVISMDVSKEHKAKPLTGAQETVDTIKGKKFKLQTKYEDGKQVASMIFEEGRPIVLTKYMYDGKDIKTISSVWYDSVGNPTFTSEQKIEKQSKLGRCLQLFLPNELLAQTLMKCISERQDMLLASAAAGSAWSAALIACAGMPATSPACLAAVFAFGVATRAFNVADTRYRLCMGGGSTTGSGGSTTSTTSVTFPSDQYGNPSSGGNCRTTVIYSTLTNVEISRKTTC